jgi:hypothetical protein
MSKTRAEFLHEGIVAFSRWTNSIYQNIENTQLIEMGIIMSVGIKKQRHYTSISYMLHEE